MEESVCLELDVNQVRGAFDMFERWLKAGFLEAV